MHRIESSETARLNSGILFRRARWSYFPLLAMLGIGCGFLGSFVIQAHSLSARVIPGFFLLISLALFLLILKRTFGLFHKGNWVLRLIGERLIVHHQDSTGETDLGAVEIPLSEIVSVRRVVERRLGISDERRESVRSKHVFLEFKLGNADASVLKPFSSPVILTDGHTFRIAWMDTTVRLAPAMRVLLDALPKRIERLPDSDAEWDYSDTLSDEQFRDRLRQMCGSNDKIGAISLVRLRHKTGLAEAKGYVEDLMEGTSGNESKSPGPS
jgi:hypothetical protein